ncbi:MAG TPA: diacylglycerol kinase family protein [bacterium]
MKVMAVVNPHSANGRTLRRWPVIKVLLKKAFVDFAHEFTSAPMDAAVIARRAIEHGYDVILSVGGDGTLNEVINGFLQNGKPVNKDAALGVISTGTGADFIKTIGFPKAGASSPGEVNKVIEKLSEFKTIRCDAGIVYFRNHNGKDSSRHFINIADFGIGGETVDRVNRTTKVFGGFVSFLFGSIVTVLNYKGKKVWLKIDGADYGEKTINSVIVANGKYFGGGMMVAPQAEIGDGLFDVFIVGDISKKKILKYGRLIYTGAHINLPEVNYLRGKIIEADSSEKVLLDIDGEQPGRLPARFEIIPSALKIIA